MLLLKFNDRIAEVVGFGDAGRMRRARIRHALSVAHTMAKRLARGSHTMREFQAWLQPTSKLPLPPTSSSETVSLVLPM